MTNDNKFRSNARQNRHFDDEAMCQDINLPEEDRKCVCGAIVTFEQGARSARCFNISCGAYLHR